MKWMLVGALVLSGCVSEPRPLLEGWGTPLDPPAVYAQWWAELEACSGLHADMGKVTWYTYPTSEGWRFSTPWGPAIGIFSPEEDAIMVVERYTDRREIVGHEMMHALIGHGGHPPVFQKCGVA